MTRSTPSRLTLVALSLLGTTIVAAATAPEANAQNPIIDHRLSGMVDYDPFTDHVTVVRNRDVVRASALDPYRDRVDPGSLVRVDRYFRDSRGRLVREFGTKWTSYGTPHGTLTRQVVTHSHHHSGPSVEWHDSDRVVYSSPQSYYVSRPPYTGHSGTTSVSNSNVVYGGSGHHGHGHSHGNGHGHSGGSHMGHGHGGHGHGPSSSTTINNTTTYRSRPR
jgi:hypothetical protein